MSIRRRFRDVVGADNAGGARTIIGDDRHFPALRKTGTERARNNVRSCAGRVGDHHLNVALRICDGILRAEAGGPARKRCRDRDLRQEAGCRSQTTAQHSKTSA